MNGLSGKLPTRDRIPFQSIVNRPLFKLPGNARIAVWVIVNIENWLPENSMPRTVIPPPMGKSVTPDIPNWCWHEYGMRVGFWRFVDVLAKRNIRPTLALNGSVIDMYEEVCVTAKKADWEFMGHGFVQTPMHALNDEVAAIRDTIEAIKKFTGKPPRGWESPGMTETAHTLDHLAAAGIEYVANWVLDDQPVRLKSGTGTIYSVPYTVEVNDVVMNAIQHHRSDEIFVRGRDQFDRLYMEGETIPRVMGISIHPYLTGAPHRIKYLEMLLDHILRHKDVVIATGGEILDFFKNSPAGK